MERLRCGVIFTDAFLAHLGEQRADAHADAEEKVLAIHYVHCSDGLRAGESWWSLVWEPLSQFAECDRFEIGELRIALSRQTQKALKWKYVDYKDGQVRVA